MTEFETVALDTLPAPTKSASAETLALGTALLAAIPAGSAAVDPITYTERKDATKRAAALKRAGAAADKSRHLASRVYQDGDAWRVAIMDAPAPTATTAPSGKGKG